MDKLQRLFWLRNKGLRWRMAWYCADLPRAAELKDFLTVAACTLSVLVLCAWMDAL